MTSRRDVLRLGTRATATGLTAGLVAAPATAQAAPPFTPPASSPFSPPAAGSAAAARGPERAAWRELRRLLSPAAGLYRPGEGEYGRLAPPDNLRYADIRPAGIVACVTERDVQTAVRWAAAHGVPLVPRSGGHNYAGYSTTRGLLIQLRRMRQVQVTGSRTLRVGGGATNSDVYAARAANLYFPGGRCPGVGVAGLTLGGGLGFNDRKWGLTCDRLQATDVVLANGELVRASAEENADLFWACRGGAGGNFGINTGFVFHAVPIGGRRATVFDLTFRLDAGVRVMAALQETLDHDRAGDFDVRVGFSHPGSGQGTINVLGQRLGTADQLRKALAGVLELKAVKKFIEQRQFWAAQDYLMSAAAVGAMASKSLVPNRWLPRHSVESIVEWVRNWRPGPARGTGYVTLFAMGAHSDSPGPRETAYPHRDATYVIDIGARWTADTPTAESNELVNQTRAIHHTLSRQLQTSAAYVNFPDPDLRRWQNAYYGANYTRLTDIKRRYDPTALFHYPQAITPTHP
ncbi:FAD-binding oxidoreductase [Streptomyces sp. NPDC126933]|uniref:FAD-binding oxidoreductase n=1 Tax=unclassified Streptomyces TaxID=2593676 RepID=UPI00364B1693